jgi:hypothetical protein
LCKENENFVCNIVCHSESNTFAQYMIIWTNYVMIVALTLVVWLKSLESSNMIALFWEHLFKKNCNIPSLLFFLATRSYNMMQCEGFFFEFLMSILKGGQNAGLDSS